MKRLPMIGLVMAAAFWAAQAHSQELTGTLRKVKETGTITIGYRDSSIPFSYLDDNQKPIGFAIDICLRIVDAVKKELKLDQLKVEFNPVTSSTRIPLLANGTVDLECGSTTNNPERLKQVAFTNTHFLTATRFVSKKASNLNSIDELKGKTVVSSAGTTNIRQLTETNAARNLGINIIPKLVRRFTPEPPPTGYYTYEDTYYYNQHDDWYYYDTDFGSWTPTEAPATLGDNYAQYFESSNYTGSEAPADFSESAYYVEPDYDEDCYTAPVNHAADVLEASVSVQYE